MGKGLAEIAEQEKENVKETYKLKKLKSKQNNKGRSENQGIIQQKSQRKASKIKNASLNQGKKELKK